MSLEQNKALVRRSVSEFYNRENLDVVDQIYAADFISHDPAGFKEGGMADLMQLMDSIYAAFPDFHVHIDELIAERDKVVKRFTIHCTHQGEFMGVAPTGKKITISGTSWSSEPRSESCGQPHPRREPVCSKLRVRSRRLRSTARSSCSDLKQLGFLSSSSRETRRFASRSSATPRPPRSLGSAGSSACS